MRICSLLPSATEIVCALGLEANLVGVSHECDFPPEVRSKPVLTRSRIDHAGRTGAEIDALVVERLHQHTGIYALDEELLARLKPDLILTQELCEVCAVSYDQVQEAVRALSREQQVLSLEPNDLAGIMSTIRAVGAATNREAAAVELVARLQQQLARYRAVSARAATHRRVACVEWLDPPFSAGHWVPEMVAAAGGVDVLAQPGDRSHRLSWADVAAAAPEVLVLMPCGFDVERTVNELSHSPQALECTKLQAVQSGEVYAVDANAYFSRPGPRFLSGIQILTEILDSKTAHRDSGDGWRRAM